MVKEDLKHERLSSTTSAASIPRSFASPVDHAMPKTNRPSLREWMRTPPSESIDLETFGVTAKCFEAPRRKLPLEGPASFTSKSIATIDLTGDASPTTARAAKAAGKKGSRSTPSRKCPSSSEPVEVIQLDSALPLPEASSIRPHATPRRRGKKVRVTATRVNFIYVILTIDRTRSHC